MNEPSSDDRRTENRELEVRYSSTYLRSEGRKLRRSTLLGTLLGLIASILLLRDGVRGWVTHAMVNMGPAFGYAKYPPTLVLAIGFIGFALCMYALWHIFRERRQ